MVALFEPLDAGVTISRAAWPAHITLASAFITSAPIERIIGAVESADPLAEPVIARFGTSALFGPNRDVPVLVVQSAQATAVHGRLTDELGTLSGFTPEEPAYWGDGYRPHLTLGASVTAVEGESRSANFVAIAELDESGAKVVAVFETRS